MTDFPILSPRAYENIGAVNFPGPANNSSIMKTRLCNKLHFFTAVKSIIFRRKIVIFFYLCSLKTLIMGTNNLCFRAKKKENNVYPFKPQFYCIKVGCKGSTLHGHVSDLFYHDVRYL